MSFTAKVFLWVLLSAISIFGLLLLTGEKQPVAPEYILGKVEQGDINVSVLATGKLSPLVTVQVGSQVSGTIQYLNVDFNSRVKKGDVIAQIEPSLFKAKEAQAKASLRTAEAARDKAIVSLRDAERKLKRNRRLRKQNMVSDSELESSLFTYENAKVEQTVQTARIAEAEAALQQTQVNLAYTTIYAPIDGIVISRDVDVGQTVAASLQAPTLFTIAHDLKKMQIEADVDEAFIGIIREGQPVSFTVYAYPERAFDGTVAQIRLNPNLDEDVVLYNCISHVNNHDLSLKPGMTATVRIKADQRKNVLKVPNAALRYLPDIPLEQLNQFRKNLKLEHGQGLLWQLTSDGQVPIKVNTGLSAETETEVSSKDIQQGMQFIIRKKKTGKPVKRKMGLRLF